MKSRGIEREEYFIFAGIIPSYGIFTFIESLSFYQLGRRTFLIQKISYGMIHFLFALFILFLLKFFREETTWFYKIVFIFRDLRINMTAPDNAYVIVVNRKRRAIEAASL